MNTPFSNTTRDAAAAAHQTSAALLDGASRSVDSTREYANDALDKAENKVRELKQSEFFSISKIAEPLRRLFPFFFF